MRGRRVQCYPRSQFPSSPSHVDERLSLFHRRDPLQHLSALPHESIDVEEDVRSTGLERSEIDDLDSDRKGSEKVAEEVREESSEREGKGETDVGGRRLVAGEWRRFGSWEGWS